MPCAKGWQASMMSSPGLAGRFCQSQTYTYARRRLLPQRIFCLWNMLPTGIRLRRDLSLWLCSLRSLRSPPRRRMRVAA
jgi:hypothetical protein